MIQADTVTIFVFAMTIFAAVPLAESMSTVFFEKKGPERDLLDVERTSVEECYTGSVRTTDYCAIIGLNQKDLENQGILA